MKNRKERRKAAMFGLSYGASLTAVVHVTDLRMAQVKNLYLNLTLRLRGSPLPRRFNSAGYGRVEVRRA